MVPVAPAPAPEAPSDWVLELGEAARRAGLRSEVYSAQGRHLRAWSSRRAAARARRRHVQELLAGKAAVDHVGVFDFFEAPPVPLAPSIAELEVGEPVVEGNEVIEDVGPALLDRISAYTSASN